MRIVAAIIGLFVSGLPGAIIGYLLGYIYERIMALVLRNRIDQAQRRWQQQQQQWQEQSDDQWEQWFEQARRQWEQFQRQSGGTYTGGGYYGGSQGGYSGGYSGGYGGGFQSGASALSEAYATLGVDSSASDDELKKAYRSMAVKYHPDKYAGAGAAEQKAAEEKFKEINSAYDTIRKSRGI